MAAHAAHAPPAYENAAAYAADKDAAADGDADNAAAADNADEAGNDLPPVVISISGTAGAGKTALAVHWGHRMRSRFPDGTLYVDLHGHGPKPPRGPAAALTELLAALGVAGPEPSVDVDALAARYRTELAGRRILVVLDNAATVDQVRPLLPGARSCLVVVTSRDPLAGLVARHGAYRLHLDLLRPADARALLRRLVGPRATAEPDATAALAEQCARLPLALRVVAELGTGRPGAPLAELVDELRDEQHRLDLLDAGGDAGTAVRTVFSWSYRSLPPDAARAFRLTGLAPGPDLYPDVAAALFGVPTAEAQRLLTTLERAQLVQRGRSGRYRSHDLLRAYALHLAGTVDPEAERREAVTRLLDCYLGSASAATDSLFPGTPDAPPPLSRPHQGVANPTAAQAWLDTHRAHLVAATAHAATSGWPGHAIDLSTALARYLDAGGYRSDELVIHRHAVDAACITGDRVALARTLMDVGAAHCQQGQLEPAAGYLDRALDVARQEGHRGLESRILANLAMVASERGHLDQAIDHLSHSLDTARSIGDRMVEARVLGTLGALYESQGRPDHAIESLVTALILFRQLGDEGGEARAHDALGTVHSGQGDQRRAVEAHEWALTLLRKLSDRSGEARALLHLGRALARQGRARQAAEHHRHALALFREMGEALGEARAQNALGASLHAAGDPVSARGAHLGALALATRLGGGPERARAHDGIAATHLATGNAGEAARHWQLALAVYAEIGLPEAEAVLDRLIRLRARTDQVGPGRSVHR